jgi:hypothetical protein
VCEREWDVNERTLGRVANRREYRGLFDFFTYLMMPHNCPVASPFCPVHTTVPC